MANLSGYDASNGETMDTRDVLPAGEYVACIVKSERREAKTAGNAYINLEFEVQDGDQKGRHFWAMLNLWNSNEQAVQIAQRELNSICHAVGKLRIDDSEELHGIPMRVSLKVDDNAQYGKQNRTTGYKPLNGAGQRIAGNASGDGPTSAPWKRSA
jgi:hypothetical protein